MNVIYSCPDCQGDLIPDEHGQHWCPACEEAIADAQLIGDDDDGL